MGDNENIENESIKYSTNDIERIFLERVRTLCSPAAMKSGVVCEWAFTYPNGKVEADVECAFCIDPENNDYGTGCTVCFEKIKSKLWKMCGAYSIITGEKL